MNRNCQGKATNVQKLKNGAKGNQPEDWEELDPDPKQAKAKWQAPLLVPSKSGEDGWQQHQLFQDVVDPLLRMTSQPWRTTAA